MIFISGGVRSGKSAFAEQQAQQLAGAQQLPLIYAATSVAFDEEMQQRIEHHQQDRALQQWHTVEVPYSVEPLMQQQGVILFECVTTWLSNIMYTQSEQLTERIEQFQQFVQLHHANLVIVSNELLFELPSVYEETELYRRELGKLHQWLVLQSDAAYECVFSHVICWKGE